MDRRRFGGQRHIFFRPVTRRALRGGAASAGCASAQDASTAFIFSRMSCLNGSAGRVVLVTHESREVAVQEGGRPAIVPSRPSVLRRRASSIPFLRQAYVFSSSALASLRVRPQQSFGLRCLSSLRGASSGSGLPTCQFPWRAGRRVFGRYKLFYPLAEETHHMVKLL